MAEYIPLPSPSSSRSTPPYQKPHLLTTYSHLPSRTIAHDNDSLAYYARAPIGADLNNGFEQRTMRDETVEEHLDGLCEGLLRYRRRGGKIKEGSLVTWRGMLTRLLIAAYADRDGWEMNALALDGNVYLEDHVTAEQRQERAREDARSARFSYYGYAYESYSTVPAPACSISSPNSQSASSPPKSSPKGRTTQWTEDMNVNTNVQWCCIVKSRIRDVGVYMGGEVDCVEGKWRESMDNCVELKTNMVITDQRSQANFERKLHKHWAQSILLGVPHVEVGFRDKAGILRQIERFDTLRIPQIIARRGSRPPWDAHHSLQTFHHLSSLILNTILPSDPAPVWKSKSIEEKTTLPEPVMWRISFEPGKGVKIVRNEGYDQERGRWGFLKEEFVAEMLDAP